MSVGKILTSDEEIKSVLKTVKTVAIVGVSPKPERDSYKVASYLKEKGYKIIPVRPKQQKIIGEKAYASLDDIVEPVDVVDVFRASDQIMPHVEEALRLKPKYFWMQLGITNEAAAKRLTEAGIDVIMDRCMKERHETLC